jgi:peptide/nickel transport system substrate-binding protein
MKMYKKSCVILAIAVCMAMIMTAFSGSMAEEKQISFVFGAQQNIKTVDPCVAYDATSNTAVRNFYDSIVMLGKSGTIEPGVAKSWSVSPDGLKYTFNTNPGIKFHDGTLLTAKDVAFSVNREIALGKGMSYIWTPIMTDHSAVAIDDYTVEINLTAPFGPFINTLVSIYVINEKLAMSHKEEGDFGEYGDYAQAWLASHEAGSGPYTLKSWLGGIEEMVFQKFKDYWRGLTTGQPDTVYFKIMPEEASIKIALQTGDIDMAHHYLTYQTFKELESYPGITVQVDPSYELIHYTMNNQRPPTDDIHVRRAICYAFNYQEALSEVLPACFQAEGPVTINMPEHNKTGLAYEYNIDKAKAELAQSKYTPEQLSEMTLDCVYVSGLEWEARLSALLKSSMSKIGLNVQLRPMPWAQMVDLTVKPETTPHFFCLSSTASYVSADYFLMRYTLDATGYTSAMWCKDKTLSDAILKARSTVDSQLRDKLYKDIQANIAERAACLWIATGVHRMAYRDYIQGYTYYGLLSFDEYWWNLHILK